MERVRFHGLLSLKRAQEHKLANFLIDITCKTEDLLSQQLTLCEVDEENVPPSAPPLEFCIPPPPTYPPPVLPSAPPLSLTSNYTSIQSFTLFPPATPPPNFITPPLEPYFADSVSFNNFSSIYPLPTFSLPTSP